MLRIRRKSQFKKDWKKVERQRKNMELIKNIIEMLAYQKTLPPSAVDHPLQGQWSDFRECHIQPDWLLIYQQNEEELVLVRTGSHAELF